jgi:hypothetical protein
MVSVPHDFPTSMWRAANLLIRQHGDDAEFEPVRLRSHAKAMIGWRRCSTRPGLGSTGAIARRDGRQ